MASRGDPVCFLLSALTYGLRYGVGRSVAVAALDVFEASVRLLRRTFP